MHNSSDIQKAKDKILQSVNKALSLIPETDLPSLPLLQHPVTKRDLDVTEWYDFEIKIWEIGEEIRQLLIKFPILKNDKELYKKFLDICIDRKAKRGRQSFIMLLGNTSSKAWAGQLITQLDDENVNGHVIMTILKMRTSEFVREIKPFIDHKTAWVKNYAKKYVQRYA